MRRTIRKQKIFVVLLIFLACAMPSCQWFRRGPSETKQQIVRVGYLRLLSGSPLYTAVREGYFKDEGLDVQLRVINSGPEGNEALAAGNLDVAFSILPSLIVANSRRVPADLVSIFGASVDGPEIKDHRIIVSKGSQLRRPEDLVGKKLAVVGWPGMTSDVLEMLDYLQRHNVDPKKVTLIGMAHGDMIANLESGVIDAAASAEPYVTLGALKGTTKTLEDGNEGFYYDRETEVTSYLARRGWVDGNRGVAEKFVRALERGRQKSANGQWLLTTGLPSFNRKGNPPIDFVELTAEQSAQLHIMPIRPLPSEAGLRHVADQLFKAGTIKEVPPDLKSLILPLLVK